MSKKRHSSIIKIEQKMEKLTKAGGFDPKFWGASYWKTLHYGSLVYKPRHKNKWLVFLVDIFPVMIPCAVCRGHYEDFIRMNKHLLHKQLTSRKNLIQFLIDLHNFVNKRVKGRRFRLFSHRDFVGEYYR